MTTLTLTPAAGLERGDTIVYEGVDCTVAEVVLSPYGSSDQVDIVVAGECGDPGHCSHVLVTCSGRSLIPVLT